MDYFFQDNFKRPKLGELTEMAKEKTAYSPTYL
jgi:hypothetical protein